MTEPRGETAGEFEAMVADRPAIDLDTLDLIAALQTRVDRKYVVTLDQAVAAVASVAGQLVALDIDGARSFRYRSLYFDTPDLSSYRGAVTRRRRRFKVRVRQYENRLESMLEVKTKGLRGQTIKRRIAHGSPSAEVLSASELAFIDEFVAPPGTAALLAPTMWTGYHRSTLVDVDDRSRVTIDRGIESRIVSGNWRPLTDRMVIETKAFATATPVDRALWAMGLRPVRLSKFGVAMALEHSALPHNAWNRVLRTHFSGS